MQIRVVCVSSTRGSRSTIQMGRAHLSPASAHAAKTCQGRSLIEGVLPFRRRNPPIPLPHFALAKFPTFREKLEAESPVSVSDVDITTGFRSFYRFGVGRYIGWGRVVISSVRRSIYRQVSTRSIGLLMSFFTDQSVWRDGDWSRLRGSALMEAKFAIILLVSLGCCAAGCRGAENKPNNLIGVMPAKGMKCRTANWRSLGPRRR